MKRIPTGSVGYTLRVTGVHERLKTTNWRAWFIGTGLAAVIAGVMTGVNHESVARGVDTGFGTGIATGIFSLVLGRDRRDERLAELSDSDRATVVRTVREGSMVRDARLASPVIAHAEAVRARCNDKGSNPGVEWLLYGFFALMSSYFAIDGRSDGNTAAAVLWMLFTGLFVAMAVLGPRRRERKLRRLERVEDSARAFLESPW